ncbi:WD40 repeat-like protein [Westerdykella ornata]|uniref:WD40 repeat-like protein n=1 Tax=Westerdykella ornata TaxID=318751 RepID=A0A6A6JHX3_WESOR|nr:WD40 repeat-like protein [Westerdykella ornata]KAF2276012.1 WD40 repeat-like protein [Westerdykella ornata]
MSSKIQNTVYDRLVKREIGDRTTYAAIPGIYGDRRWIHEMDIVNELGGHHGCVNALCWSKSGRLLASGSDDHRINIHAYNPDSSTDQFSLTASILTGHRTNIFSVKFMPYSNDRTIVSATDDVRIFDIERSGTSLYSGLTTSAQSARRPGGVQGALDGLTLTEGDTNAKAFRCHTDTVKRIVTEDSPFYFLTCSEDGDVRQWDIRQPSKTYPPPKMTNLPRWAADADAADEVPPPLISYSRYNLDLNTISCSPSQPHYIALGGAHLHCFLHDRRMTGRDKLRERGGKLPTARNWNVHDDLAFGEATRCVKKFAPNGKKRMTRKDNGHITACKISDANPNELIVSWSGDWIYGFDILRSPDASEEVRSSNVSDGNRGPRVKDKSRKRKRTRSGMSSQEATDRGGSRQRTRSSRPSASGSHDELALRVNYSNGQSEEFRIEPPQRHLSEAEAAALRETDHYRIAQTTINIQEQMFNLPSDIPADVRDLPETYRPQFTSALGYAGSILPDIDEVARTWGYPMDPNQVDVALQNHLRDHRAATRRFVQAAGILARVLGGQLRTGSGSEAIISRYFAVIQPAPNERPLPRHEHFAYDFLKALLLWLDSGLGAVVEGFSSAGSHPRFPIPPNADIDAIDDILIPYLLQLASDDPIVNVDASKFETDDTRVLHRTEKAAVITFARALKTPFADLTGAVVPASGSSASNHAVQDRKTAIKTWAFKVGRGVLWNAARDIRFAAVDRAFGGQGRADGDVKAKERMIREKQEDVDPNEDDDVIVEAEIIERPRSVSAPLQSDASASEGNAGHITVQQSSDSAGQGETPLSSVSHEENVHEEATQDEETDEDRETDTSDEDDEDEDEGDSDGEDESIPDDDEDEDEEEVGEGLTRTRSGHILWRDYDRSRIRASVGRGVSCAPHTKVYKGHCNVRTVKDVNYFGLQDEYVVSGSDSGHVFIWDRKTSQLLNILQADKEVVNVVQGHPYEPTMAVSGIDHSIKIFSPDAEAQRRARKGIGIHPHDTGVSSLGFGFGFGHRPRRNRQASTSEPAVTEETSRRAAEDSDEDDKVENNGLASCKRMHQEYEIISQNDVNRQDGRDDAYITRALLAQLAQRMHAMQQTEMTDDGGATIVLNGNEDCQVM